MTRSLRCHNSQQYQLVQDPSTVPASQVIIPFHCYIMAEKEPYVDYYKVLQCDRTATIEELKKSYQQLALTSHPDKIESTPNEQSFILIQEAWSVLRDAESRKQYDAMLGVYEHSECLLYDTISKSEMEFDSCEDVFTYPCRCGGTYVLNKGESVMSSIVIGCDECSFSILVKEKL